MDEIEQSWIEHGEFHAENSDIVTYHAWFDTTSSVKETIANGQIDFFHRILTPRLYDHLGDPRNKKCLEIGFGGGRLLLASSSVFKYAYGIDIVGPKARARTLQFLIENGRENVTLVHRDSAPAVIPNDIDFVYSFIVMQHFSSIDQVKMYIDMMYGFMAKGGSGIIFFGRHPREDVEFELVKLHDDKSCTLFLSRNYAIELISKRFKVLDCQNAGRKKVWDAASGTSGQFWVSFVKE